MDDAPSPTSDGTSREGNHHYSSPGLTDECDLIEMVNELQNKLAIGGQTLTLSLPQIVVVGCQSAGKSSVLESIVGKEFLPRGTGVVTRRPTVVQLQPCEEKEDYAIFLHKGKERFYDFEEVKNEIDRETYREPGPTGFSSNPISLKIYSYKALKLTLVDLPGIIKNVVGDQPESSIQEVRNMILDFIGQKNSLILAVSPANQDIANSDALNIAKEVDPERHRTIGVLTKLDLMDVGTNACDILENKKIFLMRGYVGVLNRSQQDIEARRDIKYSLEKEKKFFATTPCYRHLADRMGTHYLRRMLNQQLRLHIRLTLPETRKELCDRLYSLHQEIKDLERELGYSGSGTNGPQFYLIKLLQKYIDDAEMQIYGHSETFDMKTLSHGAIINFKMYSDLQDALALPSLPSKEDLMVLIANMHGIRNTLNIPSHAMEACCRHLLSQYEKPLHTFVDETAETITTCMEELAKKMDSFPYLSNEVLFLVINSIRKAAEETKEALSKHLKAEMFFVNIFHDNFKMPDDELNSSSSISDKVPDSGQAVQGQSVRDSGQMSLSSRQKRDSDRFKEMLSTSKHSGRNSSFLSKMILRYLRIQKKQIGDAAIKYVAYFLVKKVMDFLKMELIPSLLQTNSMKNVMSDCEKGFHKREQLLSTCEHLESALSAVQFF